MRAEWSGGGGGWMGLAEVVVGEMENSCVYIHFRNNAILDF